MADRLRWTESITGLSDRSYKNVLSESAWRDMRSSGDLEVVEMDFINLCVNCRHNWRLVSLVCREEACKCKISILPHYSASAVWIPRHSLLSVVALFISFCSHVIAPSCKYLFKFLGHENTGICRIYFEWLWAVIQLNKCFKSIK
jgi:hypothetical protein